MKSGVRTWMKFVFCGILGLTLLVGLGCQRTIKTAQVDPADSESQRTATDPLQVAPGADLERSTEVQLVEQMATYRAKYKQHLDLLVQFYDRQGNHLKADWASQELTNLQLGPERAYLVVAEIAGPDLRATTSILEADLIYQEALALMKEGRSGLGKMFSDKKKLYQAMDKFNELITDYPASDKIDDAAFQIGEVYNHYLKDYTTALLYYQRVWQWDPQTTLPVRFWVARIYDEHLHDRVKAIEYYEMAINLESSYPRNLVHAQNRIELLSKETAK